MRATAPQPELAAALKGVARQIPAKPLQPALLGVRLEATDGQIRVSAWDGATAAHAHVDADVDEPGVIIAPGQMLADVIGSLAKADVALEAREELHVHTDRAEFFLPTSSAHDYPTLPALPDTQGTVDGADFGAAYKRIKAAISRDAQGPTVGMRGVRIVVDDGEMQLAATDRYRIAIAYLPWQGDTTSPAMGVIPGKVLADNAAAFTGKLRVGLPANGSGAAALIGDRQFVSTTLMDWGTFPPALDSVIPNGDAITGTLIVAAEDLKAAVESATAVGVPRHIFLTITGDRIAVRGEGEGRSRLQVDASYDGDLDSVELKVNPQYLLDAITQFTGLIHFELTTPTRPFLLHQPDDTTYRHVVMPLHPLGPLG
ncbi:DNA polymerase III subunit beta [Streptomyces microflavus]|uniref:DNA polymerase III subunit beta n=1 Tax=Streptomyces microflavus TaxID=1919 RepID=UPI0032544BC4